MTMERVLQQRTRSVTVMLENLFQSHNASAVIRSCECFGVQDLYVVEQTNTFRPNRNIVRGANKWIDIHRYRGKQGENLDRCLKELRANNYKIAVTLLDDNAIPISEVPLDQKVAFCFGTEKEGATAELQQAADFAVHIPMYGFTQSFNISVSAALILQDVSRRLREQGMKWHLTESEKSDIMFRWLTRTVRHSHMLLKYEGLLN